MHPPKIRACGYQPRNERVGGTSSPDQMTTLACFVPTPSGHTPPDEIIATNLSASVVFPAATCSQQGGGAARARAIRARAIRSPAEQCSPRSEAPLLQVSCGGAAGAAVFTGGHRGAPLPRGFDQDGQNHLRRPHRGSRACPSARLLQETQQVMEAAVEAGEPGVAPLKRPAVEAQRIAPGLTLAVEAPRTPRARSKIGWASAGGGERLLRRNAFLPGPSPQPRWLSLVLRRRCPSTKASTSRLR